MPKRGAIDTGVCSTFCTYYRPGKNEDMACQSFVVVQGLIKAGRIRTSGRPGRLAEPDRRTGAILEERVCGACSFRAQDCDFIATGGSAPSCGGMVLLRHLLGSGEIKISEIKGPERKREK
jgi:hypothetical protein